MNTMYHILSSCYPKSEWLIVVYSQPKWAIFQLYHVENNVHFDEIAMMSALYLTNKLSWIFIVLAHWNNSQWVVISLNTLSWFKANWYLFLHHNFKLSRVKDSEFQQLNTIFNRLFVLNHYNFAGTIQWNVTKSECLDI
jgi:hypothetical protein